AARGFVAALLGSGSDLEETARLLVSEAVTNAVLHSASGEDGGSFEVRCRIARERLRVEVHDGGAPQSPRRRVHHLDALTGRGLDLVDLLAASWGSSGGRHRRRGPAAGAPLAGRWGRGGGRRRPGPRVRAGLCLAAGRPAAAGLPGRS